MGSFERGFAEYEKIAFKQYISDNLLVGIHHSEVKSWYDQALMAMAIEVNGYVLTENAGDRVVDVIKVALPLRPWWIPKRLWKKIPTFKASWILEVEPRWRYPDAPERHPLGRGVEYVRETRNWRQW